MESDLRQYIQTTLFKYQTKIRIWDRIKLNEASQIISKQESWQRNRKAESQGRSLIREKEGICKQNATLTKNFNTNRFFASYKF